MEEKSIVQSKEDWEVGLKRGLGLNFKEVGEIKSKRKKKGLHERDFPTFSFIHMT